MSAHATVVASVVIRAEAPRETREAEQGEGEEKDRRLHARDQSRPHAIGASFERHATNDLAPPPAPTPGPVRPVHGRSSPTNVGPPRVPPDGPPAPVGRRGGRASQQQPQLVGSGQLVQQLALGLAPLVLEALPVGSRGCSGGHDRLRKPSACQQRSAGAPRDSLGGPGRSRSCVGVAAQMGSRAERTCCARDDGAGHSTRRATAGSTRGSSLESASLPVPSFWMELRSCQGRIACRCPR